MKKSKTPFFELLGALSPEEAAALGHFARAANRKASKKTIQLLELIPEALKASKKTEKRANWLRRKLYPNDETGRYFQRVLKEAEGILWEYLAFRKLQKQPAARQMLLLESLPLPKFEAEFQSQLDGLKGLLGDSPARGAGHALDSYKYELYHEQLITRQKDKSGKHNYYATLAHLDRFYLIEKLKYATALKLWSNIYQEEPPASLIGQVKYLSRHFQGQVAEDPVLQIYLATFQLYYETADSQKAIRLLSMLKKHSGLLDKEEANNLYNLASNYNIHKINAKHLSPPELKKAYQENFQLLKFQAEEGMLREGEYIPYSRFQNVLAAALNAGGEAGLEWVERFLAENITLTPPGGRRAALEKFSQGAIHFYKGEYEKCFKSLEDFPYNKHFFYYCDVNSLRLRSQFESARYFVDYWEEIQKIKKRIKTDEALSAGHRQGYLHFFELLGQLFRACERGKPEREELAQLKARVEKTHPVAQKKWLLEKVEELESG
ncbi:MAG: hypothetical protein KDD10_29285 [Phaeodactylibacter sp.]|nr:hypothetical protein [Phaeodactylibacter sp.]